MSSQLPRMLVILGLCSVTTACVVDPNLLSNTSVNAGGLPISVNAQSQTLVPLANQAVLTIGEEKDLTTLLRTADGAIPTQPLIWTSSNSQVLILNPSNGQVKGLSAGTAILTATPAIGNPSTRVSIEVSVVEKPLVTLMKIAPPTPTLVLGDKLKLTAEVMLADGQINGNVSWTSSDDTIATVNSSTGEVSGIKTGRVTIVASYVLEPRYKAVAEVLVVKDLASVPESPSPSPIIFGPSSTPIPMPTLMATAQPSPPLIGGATPIPSPSLASALPSEPPLGSENYVPADVVLERIEIREVTGNGDGVANRGELLYVKPTFKNTGGAATNVLTTSLVALPTNLGYKTTSPDLAYQEVNVAAMSPGQSATLPSDRMFAVQLQTTLAPGTSVPLSFSLRDSFGNSWQLNGSILVR